MKTFLSVLRLTLTLFLITAVVAAALAGVNTLTEDRIAAAKEEKLQKALEKVLPDAAQAEEVMLSQPSDVVKALYASPNGFAAQVEASGFGGSITMMVGVSKDGAVLGVQIISHAETPGLGAVAAANTAAGESFRQQFAGMSGNLTVDKDGGAVDSVTGATITSRAVTEGVNAALECVMQYRQEVAQ